jgi:hypothetical protein
MQIKTLSVDNLTRQQIRSKVLRTWEAETPGSGQYRYNVEECADNSKIYLLRPANLNKGCDFVIVSENFLKFRNGNDKPPKHKDVVNLIKEILLEDITIKKDLEDTINRVYNCENINDILAKHKKLLKTEGCKSERVLKLLKWMFIEQDITYWTGDGRQMLKSHIDELLSSI